MIRLLAKGALAIVLAAGCGQTLAMCIRPAHEPGDLDPLKSEVKWALDISAAVFTGTVTAMEYVPAHTEPFGDAEMLVIRMAADSWWKGAKSREITLHTLSFRDSGGQTSTEAHEYVYEIGKRYLVYAAGDADNLHANICSRTKAIAAAAADIDKLDALKAE